MNRHKPAFGRRIALLALVALPLLYVSTAHAQLAPDIGYMFPAGAQAGTTVEVRLGGYDWTPDMQVFLHDPRIKLEIIGKPTPILVPEPPYWFGAKGRSPAWPLPREFTARLTIPADVPVGVVQLQVANANGPSPPQPIVVGSIPEVTESEARTNPQALPALPITVNGQIRRIEEIDEYTFVAPRDGPLTIELFARRLNSPLHGLIKVRDNELDKTVVDIADTEGRDLATSFIARAGAQYTLSLHDLDFAGDRSYVYRLLLSPGPRIDAAYPAAGKRGETQRVEFVGLGLATGASAIETVVRDVAFPATDASTFAFVLETPQGRSQPLQLLLSDTLEQSRGPDNGPIELAVPCAVTGSIATRYGSQQYQLQLTKGQKWHFIAQTATIGSPLDLELSLCDATGKELAVNDDVPGSVEPQLDFSAPADGTYSLIVTDRSGKSGDRTANFRLLAQPQQEGFQLALPTQLALPLGSTTKLTVKVTREAGFKGPIPITLVGLPEGVTTAENLAIPEGKNDLAIDLVSRADAAVGAALTTITAQATIGERAVVISKPILLATTMKPRIKITPEGLDDVRKVQRGSTFLAPLLIERLEGYQGPITLEMTAKQQRHRQGLASEEFVVPPEANKVEYPIFIPEWLETTKTSRMILNGVVQVPDPKGNVRTLVQKMNLRIGFLPQGALLKVAQDTSQAPQEIIVSSGEAFRLPLQLFRAPEFREMVRVELVAGESPAGAFIAEPLLVDSATDRGELHVRAAADPQIVGEHTLLIRATAKKDGKWPVVSETRIRLVVQPAP